MPLITITNSYTVLYYCVPSKHVACFKKRISDIYVTKDFSATYPLPALCLSTSSEAVALKGWGPEPQQPLENELCSEEGISFRERKNALGLCSKFLPKYKIILNITC